MPRELRTYCRICEAHCGLVAELEGERLVALRADKQHPLSRGYACVKGLSLGELHEDPDRLNDPLKRVGEVWERISWAQALSEIGAKVRELRARHGDRCIAHYEGNPTFFNFSSLIFGAAFLDALGSPNKFASHSIDINPKLDVSTQIYGLSIVHPVPDFERTQLFVCLGSNPVVSQMSALHIPNAIGRLRAIEARGGRVIIVDPRRTETAARVGEHMAITPGSDVYLLLAMLHVIAHEREAVDYEGLAASARGVEQLCAAAEPWTPERASRLTGIDAAEIRALALAFLAADGACLYMSTGVNMGPFGSLAYWVLQGLHLVAGQLDRPGGLLLPRGAFDAFRLAKTLGLGAEDEHRTRVSGWHRVAGAFPIAALPEEIVNDHPDRIRALFVSAGNPVHSVPGGGMREALDELELLVSIDIYPSATGTRAHYQLPATDMLERSDFPASHTVLQDTPFAQYTPPVVAPLHERRHEWRIFSELAMACGAPALGKSALNLLPRLNRVLARLNAELTPDTVLRLLLRWGGQTTLRELEAQPEGVLLAPNEPGSFLGKRVFTDDGKVHLDAPRILADLPRLERYEAEVLARDPELLLLIGRRDRKSHNSWMHNIRRIKRPRTNAAFMHPEDAAQRGIADGDALRIETSEGSLELPASLTSDVSRGVIAVPHGWGHAGSGLSHASSHGGGNINQVIPRQQMEPVSGQSIILAHEVRVRPAGSLA